MPRQAANSAPSISTGSPRTLLPQDPSSLTKYLHNQQLYALRKIYEQKVLAAANQGEQDPKPRRGGGATILQPGSGGTGGGAAGRRARQQRRNRRGSESLPPVGSEEGDEVVGGSGADLEEWEKRKRMKLTADGGNDSNTSIDKAHAYEFLYDLSPNGSSDAYYHGPHPSPPANVVRSMLASVKLPPFFDPDGLSFKQLESAARLFWDLEGKAPLGSLPSAPLSKRGPKPAMEGAVETSDKSVTVTGVLGGAVALAEGSKDDLNAAKDPETGVTPPSVPLAERQEYEDAWESHIIATFSTGCDANIARSMANMPPNMRAAYTGIGLPATSLVPAAGTATQIHPHSHAHSHANSSSMIMGSSLAPPPPPPPPMHMSIGGPAGGSMGDGMMSIGAVPSGAGAPGSMRAGSPFVEHDRYGAAAVGYWR